MAPFDNFVKLTSIKGLSSATGAGDDANPPSPTTTLAPELGRYWLPWHIDSQFITLLTSDDFYDEVRVRVRVRVSVRVEVRVEGKG